MAPPGGRRTGGDLGDADQRVLRELRRARGEWNYRYPWGSDHNGCARMYGSATDHNHVYLAAGVLTIKATRITWDEGTSCSDPHLPIRYHSGAVHAKDQILVTDQFPDYEVKGEFQAPSARGTWPAFWLTGVNSWPPESDILEFKGNNRNWFNTFRTSSDVSSTIVGVSSPGSWHTYRVWMTKVNATDVDIHYYLDGAWKARAPGALRRQAAVDHHQPADGGLLRQPRPERRHVLPGPQRLRRPEPHPLTGHRPRVTPYPCDWSTASPRSGVRLRTG